MSRSPALGAAAYAAEASFCEAVSTFGTRLSILNRVDIGGFKRPMLPSDRVTVYRNQVLPGIAGPRGGEFKVKLYLPGHGSTCTGAVTLTDLETLLGLTFGRDATSDSKAASSSGGTTATAGGTTTSLNVAQASGFLPGSVARAGVLGDGRGGGHPFVVTSHATSVIAAATALPAALAASDIVTSPVNISVPEGPTTNTITSTRWLLQTANGQVEAHGCYPKSVDIASTNAQLPTVEITFGCAWWDYYSGTFPPAGTMQTHTPAIVAAGSFNLGTVGSSARNMLDVRDFKLSYSLNVVEEMGPGGVHADQPVTGCVRGRDSIAVEITLDSGAASTTPLLKTMWEGGPYWLLYSLSMVDGSSVTFYLPYLTPSGDMPTQMDMDGINRGKLSLIAGTGPTTTSELTLSALRIALG